MARETARFLRNCEHYARLRHSLFIGGRGWSFQEIREASDRLAARLEEAGVAPGRLVALAMPNSSSFVPALLALWKTGAVPALVSPRYEAREWTALARRTGGVDLLCETETAHRWHPVGDGMVTALESELLDRSIAFFRGSDGPRHDDLALVKFTSGSTGQPKGIALTDGQLAAEARQVVNTLGLGPESRILCPVPLCHSYGFDLGLLPLLEAGAGLGLEEGLNPGRLLRGLAADPPSVFLGTPSLLRVLLQAAPEPAPRLAEIPWILSCTAPLSPRLVGEFQQRFGQVVCQHYGSSETGAVANHLPGEAPGRPRSVGRAMAGVTIKIVGEGGAELPVGAEGQIRVESAALAQGYFLDGRISPTFPRDGYLIGDLGRMDGEGFLEVLGRRDGLINVGGLKVSPGEVVEALESHPRVMEAIVYAVADPASGEVPEAMVAGPDSLHEAELQEFLAGRLADYKRPRRIRICRELPRGPGGKPGIPGGGEAR